jgi:MoxR-like ATPase
MSTRDTILDLKRRMGRSTIGPEQIVERLLIGLLANGNLLVEGLPGLAKTRAVKSLATHLDAGLSRIQSRPVAGVDPSLVGAGVTPAGPGSRKAISR